MRPPSSDFTTRTLKTSRASGSPSPNGGARARRRFLILAAAAPLVLAPTTTLATAQEPALVPEGVPAQVHPLPPLREQSAEQQAWLEIRLNRVLPALMDEYDVDMWILSMREYAEDPVFWSIVSPTTFAARRRSIYVFSRRSDGTVERLALGGTDQGGLFERYSSPRPTAVGDEAELWGGEQWALLREIVADRDPEAIVLNIDEHQAFADGLHAGEREALERALGSEYTPRIRREPRLAVDYIAVRIPEMMPRYRRIQETVHAMISEAFSNAVIEPGETTTEDVVWWLRQRVNDRGMTTWFQPSVSRNGGEGWVEGPDEVIRRGDLLHTDFGVVALRLRTDTQHLGYVLRDGETGPPAGLQTCLRNSNRLQDILLSHMVPGLTGNEILEASLSQMRSEGIDGTIYTHPIGDHGHGAGPLIGLWDKQDGVPNRGDVVLRPSTWHSIELQATTAVPEWGGVDVSCRQEEEAYLDVSGERHWAFRRQDRFHLVW